MGLDKEKSILLLGACGMGVGPLGIYLSKKGYRVFGSDDYANPKIKERLLDAGVEWVEDLCCFHETIDEVVVSRALACNEEHLSELKTQFPFARFVFRGDYLAGIANDTKCIAIAGSHGKTSTTACLIALFKETGIPVSYILGGFFEDNTPSAAEFDRAAEWLVLEVDESDRTIDAFSADIAVVTNIDLDHTIAYDDESNVIEAFRDFLKRSTGAGIVDKMALKKINSLVVSEEGDWKQLDFQRSDSFERINEGFARCAFKTAGFLVPANHELDYPKVERRQQIQHIDENLICVQDYAHHPTEIRSLLNWSKRKWGEQVHVVFQPHRYSRTKSLMGEFVQCLKHERVTLIPEYAAFEKFDEAASAFRLYKQIEEVSKEIDFVSNPNELWETLFKEQLQKKIILFVGAGDISLWYKWTKIRLASPQVSLDEHWLQFFRTNCSDGSVFRLMEPLKRKVTLHVGGNARFYAEPNSRESLQLLLSVARILELEIRMIGKGSNLLVPEGVFDGLIIRFNQSYWKSFKYLGDGRYFARTGASLKELCRDALSREVGGFNFMDGIPGSIGGAVRMNAGAMGTELCERLESVECVGFDGKLKYFRREDLNFTYRGCSDFQSYIVLNAILFGKNEGDVDLLQTELDTFREKRHASQPAEPSAGCMFQNPEGDSAGRLIDVTGLKGFQIGGAKVSTKHANFLITEKGATADDVEKLLEHVHQVVKQETGIHLKQEVKRL